MIYLVPSLDQARKVGSTFTGGTTWTDNSKAIFGTGGDATISYDGTNFLVNPAVVGSGEIRLGGSTNYCAFQADGDLMFAGTAQFRVPSNTFAFVADAAPSAGLKFTTTSGGSFEFTDASGVRAAAIIIDQAAIFDYGVSFPATSPAQITSNQNNYSLGQAGYARINSDAARDITGIVAPSDAQSGKLLYITNIGSFSITLKHLNASSTITNRIIGIAAADVVIGAGQNTSLIYDGTTNRWRVMFLQ